MGQTLREAIEKEGIIKIHLAEKVWGSQKATKNLYNWFDKNIIPWEKIERLAAHYPRLLLYFPENSTVSMAAEPQAEYIAMKDYKKIAEEWQTKYYITLGKLTECQQQLKG